MLALPSNFIGLFLVLLLLFCKAQHRNVVRSSASLAAQLTHYSVCFNSPMSRMQLCVSLFGTVFASMFNNSCEGLNIKFTYCSKSSLEFLLCNLVRWIQKICKSNISHSCEAKDIQGIDCCKKEHLSSIQGKILRPYFGWVATISLIHFVQIGSWCYKAKKWWLCLCQNWNL